MNRSHHIKTVLQAILVTFLWSTSFIIIKKGLAEIPAITFAGLRYGLACIFFLPLVLQPKYKREFKSISKIQWRKLFILGLILYTFTQGALFLGLFYLPSVTISLMLNFTPIIVAILGIFILNEVPSLLQWVGAVLFVVGIVTYFFPGVTGSSVLGLIIMGFGVLANAVSSIMGREMNRSKNIHPIIITFVSIGVGAFFLLVIGFIMDGMPRLSLKSLLYLAWLAGVNTTFAFTMWNHTLRSLTAMESSIINGTMLIQVAFLAWVFLGESITLQQGFGMLIAATGAILVQMKRKKNALRKIKEQ